MWNIRRAQISMTMKIQTKSKFRVTYFLSTSLHVFLNSPILTTCALSLPHDSGGGKDLATSAEFGKLNKSQSSSGGATTVNPIPTTTPKTSTSTKIPTGLVSKPNTTGYDIIKPNMGQGKMIHSLTIIPILLH